MDLGTFMLAADTARVQAGGRSMSDKMRDLFTAAPAAAVVSGLGSIYNTGVAVSNKVFGTDLDELETSAVLRKVDANWAKYYEENAEVLDTVGFIGGSFIPGGVALKGLSLARSGKGVGTFGRALGYTRNKQEEYLARGLKEVAQEGGTVFNRLNKNKLLSMSYGAADNVLQAAVFETAAALSMHQSPFFAGDSASDIAWDVVKTSLAGGVFAGGVEAFFTNGIYKQAGKMVDKVGQKYNPLGTMEQMGMTFGDEVFSVIDNLFELPKEVLQADRKLPFKYRVNGIDNSIELDTGKLYDKKLAESTKRTYEKFQTRLTEVVKSDPTVGKPVAASLLSILEEGKSANLPDAEIRGRLGDYLFGLRSIESINPDRLRLDDEILWVTPGAKITSPKDVASIFGSKKVTDKDLSFRVEGDIGTAKMVSIGVDAPTLKTAFADGADVALMPGGELRFNPESKIFRPIQITQDDTAVQLFYNTRTRQTNDSAVPTIADIATADKPPRVAGKTVTSGNRVFSFDIANFKAPEDSIEATARHLWASSEVHSLKNVTIDSSDISLLDLLVQKPALRHETVLIKMEDGSTKTLNEIGSMASFLINRKLELAQDMLRKNKDADVRDIAYKLNVDTDWVVQAIAVEFDNTRMLQRDFSRDLTTYAARENVMMTYDKGIKEALKEGDFPTAQLGYEYRKQVAVQKTSEAAAAVLGKDFELFIDLDYNQLQRKFDGTGVGASGAGFSNADYGDIARMWAQDVGKSVNLAKQRRSNATLARIQPAAADVLLDQAAGRELAAVLTKVRRTEEPLALLDGHLVDLTTKVKHLKLIDAGKLEQAKELSFSVRIPLNEKVYRFLETHHEIHKGQLADRTKLANAQGITIHVPEDALYLPPIDTRKFPYFAFVRQAEGAAFSTSETAMITARSAEELQELASKIGPEYDVIFKSDTERYFKALGDYEYSRALNKPTLDPFLRKQGKLGDFLPSLDPKAAVEDFIQYHMRKETQIVRDAVSVRYAQTFNELQYLSEQASKIATSKFAGLAKLTGRTASDPFADYIKTSLDISKRSEFTLWHEMNEFVDALGTRAYRAVEKASQDARNGDMSWEDANRLMRRMGLGSPFESQEAFITAQVGNDRNYIKQAVAKANLLLSTIALRFDWANSLVNIVSTPILLGTELASIRTAVKRDPELAGKIAELTTVMDPNNKVPVPTTTKLLMNAVHNFWTPEGKVLQTRYKDIGAIKDMVSQYHQMIEDLALTPDMVPKKWADKVGEWTEKTSTLTGNNFSEQFTRFVSADVMRQLTDPLVAAAKMTEKEQNAYISIFVNRVQGNYIASQRPIMFQGTLGAAMGLFQTYQFNLFQQLFRHIQNKDAKTIAVMGALQGTLYGANGLPLFEAINTHLIGNASINEGHKDMYSFAVQAAGKEWGDWMLYGSLSAFPLFSDKMPSLYTRGDLNPRHVTIVPVTPSQVPAVEASTRVVSSVLGIAKQIGAGADVGAALLHGLAHNGINRPLAGIAQLMQGEVTTNSGSLIAATSDQNAIATSARILGAKPMDESIALNAKFRMEAYKASDRARIEDLGTVVKQKIRDGSLEPEDIQEFAARYAQVGGRVEEFGAAMQRWSKNANRSVLNTMMQAQRSSYGQRMMEIMGADPLEDFVQPPQ